MKIKVNQRILKSYTPDGVELSKLYSMHYLVKKLQEEFDDKNCCDNSDEQIKVEEGIEKPKLGKISYAKYVAFD